MPRYIFHLSIPVQDLNLATSFYVEVLGARIGRKGDDWLDVLLWGHQITLQNRPAEVLSPDRQGKRHFGVVLPWSEWEAFVEKLDARGIEYHSPPSVYFRGETDEQGKLYLTDPSHNIIEVKTYRNVAATLHLHRQASDYPQY